MKKLVVLFLALFSIVSYGAIVANIDDMKGDDKGPGTYKYPFNKAFLPQSFDLTNFKITDDGDTYNFIFTIPINFKNEWKNENGWDVQMFDVYLDFGKAIHKQSVAGRNVRFKDGWDKVLVVSPAKNELMWKREIEPKNESISDDNTEPENLVPDILLPDTFVIEKNTLTAKIKKDKFPEMAKLKNIQVLVTSSEGYPNKEHSYIRTVITVPIEWKFGGGSDYEGDPNVIDMIGDQAELKNYKATEENTVFTTISMVDIKKGAKDSKSPAPVKKEETKTKKK